MNLVERVTKYIKESAFETLEMIVNPKKFIKKVYDEAKKEGPYFAAYAVTIEVAEDVITPIILAAIDRAEYIPILWAWHSEPILYPLYFAVRKLYNKVHKKDYFIPQRTQPPHIGHISMLEAAYKKAHKVTIGIGSSNVHNEKNPYTAYERQLMLDKSLKDKNLSNYEFVHIPDFKDDKEWFNYVINNYDINKHTVIVSGNPWVQNIFKQHGYQVETPEKIIGKELIDISATKLRKMILDNDEWQEYAASGTLHYFSQFGGKQRLVH